MHLSICRLYTTATAAIGDTCSTRKGHNYEGYIMCCIVEVFILLHTIWLS